MIIDETYVALIGNKGGILRCCVWRLGFGRKASKKRPHCNPFKYSNIPKMPTHCNPQKMVASRKMWYTLVRY